MTEREKIIDILNKNFTQEVECTPVYTTADGKEVALPQELCDIFNDIVTQAVIPYFADALIAAGIGDVKETQHRTEVTEWALRAVSFRLTRMCYPECPKEWERLMIEREDHWKWQAEQVIAKKQAEKELAEEKKDA